MPDWRKFVCERLGRIGLSPQREDEIAEEFAGYLEDRFAGGDIDHGREVPSWSQFRSDVRCAVMEGHMNDRVRSLWIPGAFMLLAAFALWRVLLVAGFAPSMIVLNQQKLTFLFLYYPWLIGLPLLGAAGAYWARRAGARPAHRVLVSLFPALGASLVFALGLLIQLITNATNLAKNIAGLTLIIVSFVVIPAAALLLGALPFLGNSAGPSGTKPA